ncbi:MAG: phosphopantetheine-binding protein, partial [Actinomycetota bacterium]|nr:phosphopantetheine-binding protein [Actinomycetota bacterium]
MPDVRDQLIELWAELLHLDPGETALDRSFLRLGGDSVLAVRMSAMVRQRLGIALALSDVRVETTVNDLLALIKRQLDEPGHHRTSLPLTVERRPDPQSFFPLLPLQQGYFVGQQDGWELSYDAAHYYLDYGLVSVDGDEAGDALADAVERLAAHQPTLRARITADGRQHVLDAAHPASLPHVTVHDLRALSPEQARNALADVRAEMSTRGPNPMNGPGIDVRLTLLPEGTGRLHLGLSLLVFDGWSSTVLNRDLLDFVADWNATLAPLELDFGDYVTAVEELRGKDAWAVDRDWWWARLDDLPDPPALPLVADPRDVAPDTMGNREMRLLGEEWQAVRT